ncbi:MAG: ATP-binding protein [Candidatus Nanoarchaeia archaeon]|nr:ATP-binding protein [Candidatus Nanoarchaeia archaeon]
MKIDVQKQIEVFKDFFDANYKREIHRIIQEGKDSLIINFADLAQFDFELSEQLIEEPEETIKSAEIALEQFDLIKKKKIKARFINLPKSQEIEIRNFRSVNLSKLIIIMGIVRQASDVRPQVTNARFECPACGNIISILQIEQTFREPSRCSCGRRGRFKLVSKDLVDAQRLIIEEAPECLEGGDQPKRISVFLKGDLVEPKMEKKTTPGCKVKIVGIVKEVPIQLKTGSQSTRYELMVDANSIESMQETFEEVIINEEDEKQILEMAEDPKIYEKLVSTIAPSIYGHEDVKSALVLQLLGGVRKERPDGTKTRGDVHILLVGDPGSGKSEMLKFISSAAPKARYISGKGASAAGLTASVVKDEFLKGWALEAGALVLANGGIACLDELDKISPEDTSAMHESMEQQTITISKANIQACYSSDTEVLTENGWKKYEDVKNYKIAQFNPKNKTIQFLPHKGLFVYDYNNKMYHFYNKRNNILVTPNHKMLTKEIRHKSYIVMEAENIDYNSINFMNSGEYINKETKYFILPAIKHIQNRKHPKYTHQHKPKKIPMDIWLEFLGYYLTEGGIQKKPAIGIPQKSKENVEKIKKCLSLLSKYVGFTLSETKDKIYTRFQITNTQLFEYLERECGKNCVEKKFPLDLNFFSKRQLKILYNALMLGDGSSDGRSFNSSSKQLINIFQAIACLIGKSASQHLHYKEKYRGNRVAMYRVCLSDRTEPSIMKKFIKKVDYNGKVFCFSTKTGFFITRRNGKIAIQGNTLRSQTTILAAANPKLGRFDPYQPIAAQIAMPSTLINRFDLIFPIRDIPTREKDDKIASHILQIQKVPESLKYEIPLSFFRKYIAYAKQRIQPKLSDAALKEIKEFYVNLRNMETSGEPGMKPIPITARQLEALVRLAEGSARVRLSPQVTKLDAKRAINILKHCLMAVGFDYETQTFDIDRISTGIPASQRSRIVIVRDIIDQFIAKGIKSIPVEEILNECLEKGINRDQVDEVLDKLRRDGYVFEPRRGFLSKI